jgi:hypothetical protein
MILPQILCRQPQLFAGRKIQNRKDGTPRRIRDAQAGIRKIDGRL